MLNEIYSLWSWWCSDVIDKQEKFFTPIFIAAVAILLFFGFLRNDKKSIPPLPPGPRGFPIVGYLPFLGEDLHKDFTELAKTYGSIYKVWLGKKLCVVVSSPSLAKEVLRDKDTTFANRINPPIAARVLTYGGKDIAFSDYDAYWKKMRKIFAREMLSNTNINTLYALRRREMKKAIKDVYEQTGKPIDIGNFSFSTNMNAIMSMLWGGSLEGDEGYKAAKEFRQVFIKAMSLMGKPNISDFFPGLARFDLQGVEKQARGLSAMIDLLLNSAIERCLNLIEAKKDGVGETERKQDFLQVLLKLKDNGDAATSMTMTELKALLQDIVVGGSDTTTTMVEWTMAELLQNPQAIQKVHQELNQVVGLTNCIEESHLPKLHYLNAVVKETFRLHPALPFLVPRSPSTTCTLGGHTIPKDTTVYINTYAIQRDPQIWDSPLKFRPERFLKGEGEQLDFLGNKFEFLPFGSGRRICAGLPLAEKMLMYQLASLLHSFEWKLPAEGTKVELSSKFGIVMKKESPLIAIPTPRLSNLDLY